MSNLFMAGLRRYFYNPVWWVSVVASIVFGVFLGDYFYRENTTDPSIYFIPQMIFAILISLTVAREMSGSAFRNKIVAGYSKGQIFFAELLLAVGACVLLFLIYFVAFALFCIPTLSKLPAAMGGDVFLGFLMIAVSTAALCYAVAMLSPRRTLGAVLCILAVIGMAVAAENIHYRLLQKEYVLDIQVVENPETGRPETVVGGRIPNPRYVDGTKRTVYELLEKLNPAGQGEVYNEIIDTQLHPDTSGETLEVSIGRVRFYPLISLGVMLTVSGLGCLFWRRKNIR